MRNPFQNQPLPTEDEAGAGDLFSPLSQEHLSEPASASIRGSMLAALDAARSAVGHSSRFALAAPAVLVPLIAVGAVGAATGESPISAPVSMFESAATSLGIVSAEEPAANEPATLAQAPTANLAPTANTGTTGAEAAAPAPNLSGSAQAQEGEEGEEGDGEEPDDGSGPAPAAVAAHEDGNGCDDILFAAGSPPFATPGGPVGCEVGNSGDHRRNGANHQDDEDGDDGDTGEETPDEGDTGDEDDAEEDGNGGVSRGLGRGHDEDRPGNGNGFGHDKHDHDPNPNGHGPGGPAGEDDGDDGDDGEPEPEPSASGADDTRPGNSGNAPGQQKKGGKNN